MAENARLLSWKIAPKWQESCMQCSSAQILLRHTTLLFVYVLLQHLMVSFNILMVKSASRNSETNETRNEYRERRRETKATATRIDADYKTGQLVAFDSLCHELDYKGGEIRAHRKGIRDFARAPEGELQRKEKMGQRAKRDRFH
ncbi:hypothetical protein V6N13_068933 [Hibiscus sabdariffa]